MYSCSQVSCTVQRERDFSHTSSCRRTGQTFGVTSSSLARYSNVYSSVTLEYFKVTNIYTYILAHESNAPSLPTRLTGLPTPAP